ncbi:MAG: methyltransferase domain-containing protein [Myxococcota bacterium]|nr:methyltransferase domain-containing protein [Myxococcota bacterium]
MADGIVEDSPGEARVDADSIQTRSYDLDQLDRNAEETRLATQAQAALELELRHIRRLGIDPSATLVDVGCGPGLLSAPLAGMVPDGRVVGVDADPKLLAQARARAAAQARHNAAFVQAWADRMPLDSDMADLTYARFLFQHLPHPVAVAQEMARVTKTGGRVVVVDTDDSAILVEPPVPGLEEVIRGSQVGQARMGGDRLVGRKLRRILHEAGLVDIEVQVVPFTSDMVGMKTFADICLGFKAMIVPPEIMAPEAVQATLREVYALADDPGSWAQTLAYMAVGRVP